MKNLLIIVAYIAITLSPDWAYSDELLKNRVDLEFKSEKYLDKAKYIRDLESISDPMLRNLKIINDLVSIDAKLSENVPYLNIGFVGRKGDVYEAGVDPDGVVDEIDRKNFKMKVKENEELSKTHNVLLDMRSELVTLLRNTIEALDDKYKEQATKFYLLMKEPTHMKRFEK